MRKIVVSPHGKKMVPHCINFLIQSGKQGGKIPEHTFLPGASFFIEAGMIKAMLVSEKEATGYGSLIATPENPSEWPSFRDTLTFWRREQQKRLSYTGSSYDDPVY